MSKERIDEIIREHINISYKTNLEHIRRTRKAMEQYGSERYEEGRLHGEQVGSFKLVILGEKLASLQQHVKAQKELINLLDKADRIGYMQDPTRVGDLRNKIKQLEL